MLRVVAGAALSAAVLSGCGNKEPASTSLPAPTTKAAPTTAALPPLGPPDFPVPAAARTKDAAGAEAFTRYYIELSNRMQDQLKGQPLRDLGPNCDECLRFARQFELAATKHRRYVGGRVTLNAVTPAVLTGDEANISFAARQDAVRLLDSTGRTLDSLPLKPVIGGGVRLAWSDVEHSWIVKALGIG